MAAIAGVGICGSARHERVSGGVAELSRGDSVSCTEAPAEVGRATEPTGVGDVCDLACRCRQHRGSLLEAQIGDKLARRHAIVTPHAPGQVGVQPWPSALWLRGNAGVNTYRPVPTFQPGRHFPFSDSVHWS